MNRLAFEERSHILGMLAAGATIRAATRLTGTSKNTVAKLLADAGRACAVYHDAHVRNVAGRHVHVIENWSFDLASHTDGGSEIVPTEHATDIWTSIAIDKDTGMILSCLVGARDAAHAFALIQDLALRVDGHVVVTGDGIAMCIGEAADASNSGITLARILEAHGAAPGVSVGYAPLEHADAAKHDHPGRLGIDHRPAGHAGFEAAAVGMPLPSFMRPADAVSRRVENHAHAVALHILCHNFLRVDETSGITPAMAAGVADRPWEIGDIVDLVEAAEAEPASQSVCPQREKLDY